MKFSDANSELESISSSAELANPPGPIRVVKWTAPACDNVISVVAEFMVRLLTDTCLRAQ
jgi:hypothetical protein